jgi:NAD dependent epimerase/dehydratase family enzyme
MSKILISGGSGLIGRHISKLLIESNHNVAWLSREGGSWNGIKKHIWYPNNGIID